MKTYDLHLPDWGPYNKKYLGAAHIADPERGWRFDLNLFPGYYRRSVMNPLDVADCGAKMMASSKDLSHYIYRYELEWKDKVYIDADFCSRGNVMTVTCDFVNETDLPESLTLNAIMSMQRSTDYKREIIDLLPILGKDTKWIDGADYTAIETEQKIAKDGLLLGEKRGSGFVGGRSIRNWSRLEYRLPDAPFDSVGLRYRGGGRLLLNGQAFALSPAEEPTLIDLPLREPPVGRLVLECPERSIELDGIALGKEISFDDGEAALIPTVSEGLSLRFGDLEYKIECDCESFVTRTLQAEDVGMLLSSQIHNHVQKALGKQGHFYFDLFLRPVFVSPKSRRRITLRITAPERESMAVDHTLYEPLCNSAGREFTLSQRIMSAVTLTNVVWPIYSRKGYIRHNTPGRNWDSLYTWDSGFIGMGLAEMDPGRAVDCLNAYLTPLGDPHSPYILHGTPLPTQILLFAELFNKSGELDLLRRYYPLIRQQYRFFADARKNGRAKESGLFNTWDLFYNSGGWDDYPTQEYIHSLEKEDAVCPMVNVSFTVLCAKLLKPLAALIGEETAEYDEDIAFYSEAVNTYGWDEPSGYYGYVEGKEVLKIDGLNADMGMDGSFPYIAGISDEERSARIVQNIEEGMFTPIGVSAVDLRAPYYREDGYWNGSVWMPHQWLLWKAFLDNGETEKALYIAHTALETWKKETDHTYNCYEHFMIANGRGAGFHQFSGLSTPVLMWFNALYKPYTVTSGFFTVITEQKREKGHFSFEISSKSRKPTLIVTLEEDKSYRFSTQGAVSPLHAGSYLITFSGPCEEKIEITEEARKD